MASDRGALADDERGADTWSRRAGAPQGSRLTDLGCPDCAGVLAVTEEPSSGLLVFACRVGHTFSDLSLIAAKEDQLESALWSAVELYEQLVLLHTELGRRAERRGAHVLAARYRDRAARSQTTAEAIRGVVGSDRAALVPEEPGERAHA